MRKQLLQRIKNAARIRAARAFPAKLRRISLSAPIATISFDDFARNAWTAGGEIVESAGARATYYVSGGFCRHNAGGLEYFSEHDLEELHSRGHEAGCHTFSHFALPDVRNSDIHSDIARNAAFIRRAAGQDAICSFAYPFGAASIRSKLFIAQHFAASRGIEPGINAGWADFSQLRAICLQSHFLKDFPVARLAEEACASNGWLILVVHDVSSKPTPYGCTPQTLKDAIKAIQSAGIALLTAGEALKKIAGQAA